LHQTFLIRTSLQKLIHVRGLTPYLDRLFSIGCCYSCCCLFIFSRMFSLDGKKSSFSFLYVLLCIGCANESFPMKWTSVVAVFLINRKEVVQEELAGCRAVGFKLCKYLLLLIIVFLSYVMYIFS